MVPANKRSPLNLLSSNSPITRRQPTNALTTALQILDKLTAAGSHYFQETKRSHRRNSMAHWCSAELAHTGCSVAKQRCNEGSQTAITCTRPLDGHTSNATRRRSWCMSHARINKKDSKSQRLNFMVPHNAFMN